MADQTPPPPPGFDTVVQSGGAPPPPPGFDTVVQPGAQQPSAAPSGPGDPGWENLSEADKQIADLKAGRNPVVEGAKRDVDKTKGFIKGIASTGAGLLDMVNTSAQATPSGGIEAVPMSDTVKHFADWLRTRSTSSNPDQETGQIGEAMAELGAMGGGPEGEAKIGSLAQKFGFMKDLATFAEKYPFMRSLMKVGLDTASTGARAAAEQGAQTYLKTEDPDQAAAAARAGGAAGAVLGGGASALQETAAATRRLRPGTLPLAGADFETKPGTQDLLLRNLQNVDQDPATQAVDEALGNIGKTAVVNSMNASNAARAPEATIIPPSRQLPGRSGFEVGPAAEPTPVVEGQTAFDPGKQQIGTRVVEGKGPGQFSLPQYSPELAGAAADEAAQAGTLGAPNPQPEPAGSHREPVWQYRNTVRPGSPEPGIDVAQGPGVLILTDDGQAISAERARQQIAQHNYILDNEDDLGIRQRQQIESARDDLQDQLNRYDNFAASQPHFAPLNPLEAARNTDSLSDAAEHLKAAHGRFWQAADAASGGQFSDLRDEEIRLRKQIFGAQPTGRLDELRQQLADNQQRQLDFFDQYKTSVSPQEWQTARQGYQDGIVLQNLDDLLQKNFNGITRAEEGRGVAQRVFDPSNNFNQQLENFYSQGYRGSQTNRQVLMRTIGQNHMDNLKRIGTMFQNADRMDKAQGLLGSVGTSIRRHYHGMRGMLAGESAGAAGVGYLLGHGAAGVAAGAGIGLSAPLVSGTIMGTRRFIIDSLINDPAFLRQFNYAIENGLPPRTAAPLLAARLIAGQSNAEQRQIAARAATTRAQQGAQ